MIVRFWSVLCVGVLVASVQSALGNNDNEGTKISKFFTCIYLFWYNLFFFMCFVITYWSNFATHTNLLNENQIYCDVFHKSPNSWLSNLLARFSGVLSLVKVLWGWESFQNVVLLGRDWLRVVCGCRRNRPDHFFSCMMHTLVFVTCRRTRLHSWVCGAFCRWFIHFVRIAYCSPFKNTQKTPKTVGLCPWC